MQPEAYTATKEQQQQQKDARADLHALYSALKALPSTSESPAIFEARAVIQSRITAVKATLMDAKPVRVRLANTEAFLAKQKARLSSVEEELNSLSVERTTLKETILEKENYVNQLKLEVAQAIEEEHQQPASNGTEELAELLAVVGASGSKRAKALAEAVQKIWHQSTMVTVQESDDEELSGDEMDREMYGEMCGAILVAKSGQQPEEAAAEETTSGIKKGTALKVPSFVKQKIEKINGSKSGKSEKPFHRGGPLQSFGAPKRPSRQETKPGFVAPGVETEDY